MAVGERLGSLTIIIVILASVLAISDVSALTIERDFIGGTPQPNAIGAAISLTSSTRRWTGGSWRSVIRLLSPFILVGRRSAEAITHLTPKAERQIARQQ
jgi:hypothetical protein